MARTGVDTMTIEQVREWRKAHPGSTLLEAKTALMKEEGIDINEHQEEIAAIIDQVAKLDYCCPEMRNRVEERCEQHPDPFDCPDNLFYRNTLGEFGIIVHDGGPSYIKINYCPFCGENFTWPER